MISSLLSQRHKSLVLLLLVVQERHLSPQLLAGVAGDVGVAAALEAAAAVTHLQAAQLRTCQIPYYMVRRLVLHGRAAP